VHKINRSKGWDAHVEGKDRKRISSILIVYVILGKNSKNGGGVAVNWGCRGKSGGSIVSQVTSKKNGDTRVGGLGRE